MRLDSLVNLIGTLDPSTFRDVARRCLVARGFRPALADGPDDGGADFLLYQRGQIPAPCAVQVSVEKDWKSKLKEDAGKVARLGYSDLLFISSRRLPNVQFVKVQDEILSTSRVMVQKMDAQDVAGLAIDRHLLPELLKLMGIVVPAPSAKPFQRPDLRRDVAYACAFFGHDARDLRRTALEEAILTAIAKSGGEAQREVVIDQVALTIGLAASQRSLLTSTMDRLLQKGRIRGKNGEVSMDPPELETRQAALILERENINALRQEIGACLEPFVKNRQRREAAVEAIFEDIGVLLLDAAARVSTDVEATGSVESLGDSVRARLSSIQATLETFGLDVEKQRSATKELARRASESALGKHLLAGEMTIQLLRLRTSHLLRALEGKDELNVVLDTSVAMPLLCTLLYGPADQEYFVAAKHVYEQLLAHGIAMTLPQQYLEEIASHLLDAYRDYLDVIDLDPDLRASTNAFVAHYVALREHNPSSLGSFTDYLRGFGLNEAQARGDFFAARDGLMRRIQALLPQYGIHCHEAPAARSSLRLAEESIARAQRELPSLSNRRRVLLEHDAKTIAWMHGREADARIAYAFCTWDRLHFEIRRQGAIDWDVLAPVALGDVLALAAPEDHELQMSSAWVLALKFSDADAARGAEVWDFLVQVEKGGLYDAQLRAQARAFKDAWLAETDVDPRARDLQSAWERWKSEHLQQI